MEKEEIALLIIEGTIFGTAVLVHGSIKATKYIATNIATGLYNVTKNCVENILFTNNTNDNNSIQTTPESATNLNMINVQDGFVLISSPLDNNIEQQNLIGDS